MKRNDLKNYIGKNIDELKKNIIELEAKLSDLQFDLAAGKVKNIKEIRALKKSIAQLLTLVRSKQA